ncbi:MAG: glycosyl transferase [Candidatus Eisenbacteria bacterium]|nr:glycosyl transferase [Candidatus Eisenbacteria bacterium]MCC7140954.1 glycosyl transferase [Candidatus Eisenbacteria bacterium]
MQSLFPPGRFEPTDTYVTPGRLLRSGAYTLFLTAKGTSAALCDGHSLYGSIQPGESAPEGWLLHVLEQTAELDWFVSRPVPGDVASSPRPHGEPGVIGFTQTRLDLELRLDICLGPEGRSELRRLRVNNRGSVRRRLMLTSYLDVVLNDPAAHASHPAFSKLFVQTERHDSSGALLARRRPRGSGEAPPWLGHAMLGTEVIGWETDRARFIGRGRTIERASALQPEARLSGTLGNVLDPCLALRGMLELAPGEERTVDFLVACAPDREATLSVLSGLLAEGTRTANFVTARRTGEAFLAGHQLTPAEADAIQSVLGRILQRDPSLRAPGKAWSQLENWPVPLSERGVRPDRPRIVIDLDTSAHLLNAVQRARAYAADLGVWLELAAVGTSRPEHLSADAHFVPHDASLGPALLGSATWFVGAEAEPTTQYTGEIPIHRLQGEQLPAVEPLEHWNGLGGFTARGDEYVLRLSAQKDLALNLPPRPWVNVIANPAFGCLISETGSGYTWSRNSREHRLTPWYNDPLCDPPGEVLLLRDEESGASWSPLPGPIPDGGDYEVRHGIGYSAFRHRSEGLEQRTTVFVADRDSIKCTTLEITNHGRTTRHLSCLAFARLVLGVAPEESGRYVVTESVDGMLLARNPISRDFSDGVTIGAMIVGGPAQVRSTGDCAAVLGASHRADQPEALAPHRSFESRFGAGYDPCFAHCAQFAVSPGATLRLHVLLGEAIGRPAALELGRRYCAPGAADLALAEVRSAWQERIGGVRIVTPAPDLDLMFNSWLPYQLLSCRLWGRSALYQSGGAFGFRDQLQDASALVYLRPDALREQILLHAAHQFVEGDVLHWWHPPLSRGIRTRFADDLVWLPYLTTYYLAVTGDDALLDADAPFLAADLLPEGHDEQFLLPRDSGTSGPIYDHCTRVLDRSLTRGSHGLPLFGTGDWNDGMNRVGREGRGESVWMGFFLYETLGGFIPLCRGRGDTARAERYETYRTALGKALNEQAWDGAWYRRGYYDNGEPLGSSESDECRIDALVQAWSVLSGAATPERAAQAIDAVERHLVSEPDGIIRLLTPPFETTTNDPGYIKGYVRGVRENGGQYTHGVLWVVRALAQLGRTERAARLLSMMGPIHHSRTAEAVAVYQVEPYVIAADIYGAEPHVGRGGWTWYTGSAGWAYRILLESILGLTMERGTHFRIAPCVPRDWAGYRIEFVVPGSATRYHFTFTRSSGTPTLRASVDGDPPLLGDPTLRIPLLRDDRIHSVAIELPEITA